jgi:DNA polymerase I-like protein with 3'-5' exonuclease and polymerase domains
VDSEVIKILAESERRGLLLNQDEGLLLESRLIDESKKLKTQAALLAGTNFDPNKPNDVKKVCSNLYCHSHYYKHCNSTGYIQQTKTRRAKRQSILVQRNAAVTERQTPFAQHHHRVQKTAPHHHSRKFSAPKKFP